MQDIEVLAIMAEIVATVPTVPLHAAMDKIQA